MKNKILSFICILLVLVLTFSGCGGSLVNGDIFPEIDDVTTDSTTNTVVSLDDIPEYSGSPYVAINDNQPSFTKDEYTTKAFEEYAELDSLGRCGVTYVCVGVEIMHRFRLTFYYKHIQSEKLNQNNSHFGLGLGIALGGGRR